MYKKVLLLFFSGTGNTKIVTNHIKKGIMNRGIICDSFSLEEDFHSLDFESYDLIGIGFPIYGFRVPNYLLHKLKSLQSGSQDLFFYKTGGGESFINNSASHRLIKLLQKKGYKVISDLFFEMPSNWLIGCSTEKQKQLYEDTKNKIDKNIDSIIFREGSFLKYSIFIYLFCNIIGYCEENWGGRLFGRMLKIQTSCNKCGLCERKCPTKNIKNRRFGWKCLWCMRCIYSCPQNSIKARIFGFTVLKNGYSTDEFTK